MKKTKEKIMKKNLVSPNLAWLSARRGFNEPSECFYEKFDDESYELRHYDDRGSGSCYGELHRNSVAKVRGEMTYSAPTLVALQDWIRDTYGVDVFFIPVPSSSVQCGVVYCVEVVLSSDGVDLCKIEFNTTFKTPQEALDYGMCEYLLTKS